MADGIAQKGGPVDRGRMATCTEDILTISGYWYDDKNDLVATLDERVNLTWPQQQEYPDERPAVIEAMDSLCRIEFELASSC